MKGLKSFAVTFAVSAVIIGIVACFVTNAVDGILLGVFERRTDELSSILNSTTEDSSQGQSGLTSSENQLSALSGDSYSMLIVCTDYRPSVYDNYLPDADDIGKDDDKAGYLENGFRITGANNICLAICSKETGGFVFIPIPSNMNVYTSSGYETLYNIYGYYGFDYFLTKIEAVTGISIDYYAVINCTDITSMVNILGAVNCTVPCDIFTDGTVYVGTTTVTREKLTNPDVEYKQFLEPCTDNIGPSSMGLLLFRDYSDGIDDELTITGGYTKGVFRNFAKLSSEGQASMWSRLSPLMSATNIDSDFFSSHGALVSAYSDDIATTLTYPGNFKLSSDVDSSTFEPNISSAIDAFSSYR